MDFSTGKAFENGTGKISSLAGKPVPYRGCGAVPPGGEKPVFAAASNRAAAIAVFAESQNSQIKIYKFLRKIFNKSLDKNKKQYPRYMPMSRYRAPVINVSVQP